MKYSSDAAAREIMLRSRNIKLKHEKKRINALSFAVFITVLSMVGTGVTFAGRTASDTFYGVYGSFLMPGSAGGYVLVAVIAFSIGVAITLYLIRKRRRGSPEGESPESGVKDED